VEDEVEIRHWLFPAVMALKLLVRRVGGTGDTVATMLFRPNSAPLPVVRYNYAGAATFRLPCLLATVERV
jgi:hypothetical protein